MALSLSGTGQGGVFTLRGGSFGGRFQASVTPPPSIDSDAQAFFNRVTTAGGTLSATEQSAVNTLTIALKAAGIWTKMRVIYPMVGASAVACAQNLKSSSFTGTFIGGWTYASAGVTSNGTNAYMETNFNNQSNWTSTSNGSMGFVSATNNLSGFADMGSCRSVSNGGDGSMIYATSTFWSSINGTVVTPGDANASTIGFFVTSRTTSTEHRRYKRGSSIVNRTIVDAIAPNLNLTIVLGAGRDLNNVNGFSSKQYNFCFIGDGLTEAQVDSYWIILQTFNTSLSRQV